MAIINTDMAAYSYKKNAAIPHFPDSGSVTVMDAYCSLCARGASWIARNDHDEIFRIIPLQSELGEALMRHYGLDPADPLSWLYIEDGHAFSSLDAFIRVGRRLGGFWRILVVLRVMPRVLQDYLYGCVARNRYRIFGTTDLCRTMDVDVKKRLII